VAIKKYKMKPIQVNIETAPYATTKWYSATITFENQETEEEYQASMAVAEDDILNPQIIEIAFTDGLPEGIDEEEIKRLIEAEFDKSEG
jgi:hypothetical protein